MLRHTRLYNVTCLGFFYRQKHIRLSPVADAFNYGPKNIPIKGKKVTGLFGVGPLTDPSGFKTILDECYSDCHMLVYEAKDPNRKRKMVQILDDLSDSLCRVADLADCIRALHPDQVYQSAANAVCIHVGNLVESLNTDVELYNVSLKAITDQTSSTQNPETDCDSVDKRVLSLFIEDFEQSGVHLKDISDRQAFLKAASENLELGVEFNRVANSPVILDSSSLNGISKDVDWKPFNGRKLYAPFYEAPQQFLRALTYALFYNPVEGQEERLFALLDSRDRMAKSAGKESFLYRAVQPTSLAESPEGVEDFLTTLSSLLSPIATRTTRSQLLIGLDSKQELVSPWDVPFLIHQGQRWSRFERLRGFFSLGACMEGVGQLASSLFGLRLEIEPALPGEVWHPDVVKVSVYADEPQVAEEGKWVHPWEVRYPIGPGVKIGVIYCDFFHRPGKMSVDCHYTVRGGRHTENTMFESYSPYQFPIVVIQLNLGPSPCENEGGVPTLLTPGQVENLFHEWGHALHSVLGRTRYQHVTGTRCSTDLAELPSTLMEHFALDTRVTAQYARHFETGEAPNSAEDVKALLHLSASRGYGQSVEIMLQLMHSMLDQRLHSDAPSNIFAAFQTGMNGPPSARLFNNLLKEHCSSWLSVELPQQLAHLPVATTHRFGHLYSYGGRYYSYLMARAAAGLIWRKGFAADPWSSNFGRKYRDILLRHGGERRPQEMLSQLLGGEGKEDMKRLAQGLCEDVVADEETAQVVLSRAQNSSWNLVR
ncbi:unnamed protein product [Hymenolepis diminuta]|uniref:Peptidase M3A/M3B catalytic domain-containing protein n=1 Tax=Hymenolepis diminuta TaxID=6216 RepID=A0A564YBQ8_HYMDI|nr:unnamed protein product [Hymenolepis diminuta]